MKRFDDKFTDQVKQAFGSYNADHQVDAGWKSFQQKKAKSNRFVIILPLWAKAASIIIIVSIGSFVTYTLTQKSHEELVAESNEKVQIVDEKKLDTGSLPYQKEEIAVTSVPKEKREPLKPKRSISEQPKAPIISQLKDSILIVPTSYNDTTAVLAEVITATHQTVSSDSLQLKSYADSISPPKATIQKQLLAENIIIPEDEKKDRGLSLSAGLSGMIAQVESMLSSAPGVSVGLYAQQQLTDRIAVRPGLALAKHTYSLENLSSSSMDYIAPVLNGMEGEVVSAENHLDIVAMEIPVNFVFDIVKKRHKSLFVTAGASTLIYLNQHFTGSYLNSYSDQVYNGETGEWDMATNYTRVNIDNKYGAFSRTDFFGLANISAGYLFPLGKNSMLIEPFIQIPVRDITSSDLKISFGGISFKYQINR